MRKGHKAYWHLKDMALPAWATHCSQKPYTQLAEAAQELRTLCGHKPHQRCTGSWPTSPSHGPRGRLRCAAFPGSRLWDAFGAR